MVAAIIGTLVLWATGIPIAWMVWGIGMLFRQRHPEDFRDFTEELTLVLLWPVVLVIPILGALAPLFVLLDVVAEHRHKSREQETT